MDVIQQLLLYLAPLLEISLPLFLDLMAPKKRKHSNVDLPPNSIPQFQLDTLSVSGGIEATIETLMASRNDRQVYTILSKQIPHAIVVLLASEFLLRHRVPI